MKRKNNKNKKTRKSSVKGFTIIEVMIVLAIAGLIMLILFLAIPAAMRSKRNHTMKTFANFAAAQMDAYKLDKRHFPKTEAEQCDFIKNYLVAEVNPSASCIKDTAKDCIYVNLSLHDVCFHDFNSPHSYGSESSPAPEGELSLQYGHWCNTPNKTDGTGNPIVGTGNDTDTTKFVIWASLESRGSRPIYCIDNAPSL